QTDVQLGGLLGPYRVKWLQGTDRPRIGDEELPVIGEALGMTETCVPGGRQANEFFLVTHKAAVERVAPSFTGGWVIPILTDRHAHGIRQRWMVAVEELALVSRFVKIKAQPADDFLAFAKLPGQLTKYPVAVHQGIRHPGQGIAAGCGDHLVD